VKSKSHPFSIILFMNMHIPTSSTMTSPTNAFKIPTKAKYLVAHLLLHNNQPYNYNNLTLK
jgi:hypothetical protein